MTSTKKLYWDAPKQLQFEARVLERFSHADHNVVVLDATAFYPEGGGQPADRGALAKYPVLHVESLADGRILHHLSAEASLLIGQPVRGEVDAQVRRDHVQQHTGQHILSQAFFRLFGAATRGFRLLSETTQIDLALDLPAANVPAAIQQAEILANQIVWENRAIRALGLTPAEAAQLPLRSESTREDGLRVIEIDDFDWSPCGGTHATQTGEVGLIAVRGWERAKQLVRLDFLCGQRALSAFREANDICRTLAQQFTVKRTEVPNAIARLLDEQKQLQKRVKTLGELAAQVRADELLRHVQTHPHHQSPSSINPLRVISRMLEETSFDEAKLIAHRLVAHAGVVALLAIREADALRFVFARATDVSMDINAMMKDFCTQVGGRGGGKPDFAQGGCEATPEAVAKFATLPTQI